MKRNLKFNKLIELILCSSRRLQSEGLVCGAAKEVDIRKNLLAKGEVLNCWRF